MIPFERLSYWEKRTITENIDLLIIGGGIVGSATAFRFREKFPTANIVIVERGYISTGASTKNAGFACFGSLTELADDLTNMTPEQVWQTVAMRWNGLKRLQERFSPQKIDLQIKGAWDLIRTEEENSIPELNDKISYFNGEIETITGKSNCFSFDKTIAKRCGFSGITGGFHNALEGELDTGKLWQATQLLLAQQNIISLFGIEVLDIISESNSILIDTNFGELKSKKVAVTVNGFAQKLLNDTRIQPARAQVLVTSKIKGFELPGTFHYQKGYYYFRSIDNRLLLGGGRNLDFLGETTTELENTQRITNELKSLIQQVILPNQEVTIDYEWAGIMGVGNEKKPIVELIHPNVGIGVRMGGMGVAIGSIVGDELADLLA